MTMSVGIVDKRTSDRAHDYTRLTFTVVSATNGTASGTTTRRITGEVWRVVFVPAAAGSQPSDQFDVTITDENGYDILCGLGADISNAATTTVTSAMGAVVGDKLTLNGSNIGDTKGFTCYLYIK